MILKLFLKYNIRSFHTEWHFRKVNVPIFSHSLCHNYECDLSLSLFTLWLGDINGMCDIDSYSHSAYTRWDIYDSDYDWELIFTLILVYHHICHSNCQVEMIYHFECFVYCSQYMTCARYSYCDNFIFILYIIWVFFNYHDISAIAFIVLMADRIYLRLG